MSEDNKPIEVKAEEKTEERATGEMAAVATPSEADAPKMPEAKASSGATSDAKPAPNADSKADKPEAKADAKPEAKADSKGGAKPEPKSEAKPDAKSDGKGDAKPADAKSADPEPAVRAERETAAMPVAAAVGAPPEVPSGDVENPTFMPPPSDVPSGAPADAAKPPGHVPSGDSRSLRRGAEFALVYRQGSAVISRFGAIGTRGQWRVVEYPTPSSASNAYAKECSRFVGEGFSDYRD